MSAKTNPAYQITYPFIKEVPEKPKFPAARYFQVHFEYMESQLQDTRNNLEQLQLQVAALHAQLTLLTAVLNESKEPK
ncbi:hypothetical protein MCAMS1_00873 [biofilm metagenome]